jgi:hypothetical protein
VGILMAGDGKDTTTLDRVLRSFAEQPGHAAWGFVPVAICFWLWGHPMLAGALAGLALALPRELIDQRPINRIWDTVLDLVFFAGGGALAGWLLAP